MKINRRSTPIRHREADTPVVGTKVKTFRLPVELIQRVERARGEESFSDFVRDALMDRVKAKEVLA